jgi:hypothetical protein
MERISRERLGEIYEQTLVSMLDGDGVTRKHGSPMQDPEELWVLLQRLYDNRPLDTIIELGVCQGGGLKVWEQILPQNKNSLLIGVDWNPNVLWDWKSSPVDIRILKGDTHNSDTWACVKSILGDRKADFLFIDAQHWPKDVELDMVDYGGFVRDNGIIGFHDVRLCRSFWSKITGGSLDSGDKYLTDPEVGAVEHAVFHTEEIKISTSCGIFWKLPNQTVIKFREA